ncbi:DNA helicase, partial [Escherichia coli]|nr:DNA helicase [Escherichia coli]
MDKLIKAQAEKKKIQEGNDFGHSAFGSDWRGERSDSSSLMALVEWMRTLRGVGAEARLLASRLIDRESVKLRAQQLSQLLQQVRTPLDILWGAFGFSPEEYFSNQVSITRVSLGYIEEKVQNLIAIDEQCFRVMVNP